MCMYIYIYIHNKSNILESSKQKSWIPAFMLDVFWQLLSLSRMQGILEGWRLIEIINVAPAEGKENHKHL